MPNPKLFMLTVDLSKLQQQRSQFIAFINNNKFIEDWSSPYEGVFLIASNSPAEEIASSMDEFIAKRAAYLVSGVELGNNYGSLPEVTWNWLQKFDYIGEEDA